MKGTCLQVFSACSLLPREQAVFVARRTEAAPPGTTGGLVAGAATTALWTRREGKRGCKKRLLVA